MEFGKPRTLERLLSKKSIILYGAGAQSKSCIDYISQWHEINLFDSDSRKWNKLIHNTLVQPITDFSAIYIPTETAVIISSVYNQYEIAVYLQQEHNVIEEDLYGFTNEFYERNVYVSHFSPEEEMGIKTSIESLEDEESKKYYSASLEFRVTRNPLCLIPNRNMKRTGEYSDFVKVKQGDVIIDCGAYTGDSAEMYFNYANKDCQVVAIEPFYESYVALMEKAKKIGAPGQIKCFQYAISDVARVESFCYDNDDLRMGINIEKQQGEYKQYIDVINLDRLLSDYKKIDFIKMDIEGEELNAINGAKEIIHKFCPRLMVSAYHHHSHLCFIIPQLLKLNPNYKFYLGHTPGVSVEAEIYAI